jgi:hypothetical protein
MDGCGLRSGLDTSLMYSWLHPLKGWSLQETRGGSESRRARFVQPPCNQLRRQGNGGRGVPLCCTTRATAQPVRSRRLRGCAGARPQEDPPSPCLLTRLERGSVVGTSPRSRTLSPSRQSALELSRVSRRPVGRRKARKGPRRSSPRVGGVSHLIDDNDGRRRNAVRSRALQQHVAPELTDLGLAPPPFDPQQRD